MFKKLSKADLAEIFEDFDNGSIVIAEDKFGLERMQIRSLIYRRSMETSAKQKNKIKFVESDA